MGPIEKLTQLQWDCYTECRKESARKMATIIVDMDGTLALKGERNPYDWHKVGEDLPNLPVVWTIQRLQVFSTVLVVSGRDEVCRWQTEMWLTAHGILFHDLFMRAHKDNRPDHEIKREIYLEKLQPYFPNIVAVFDDRQQCCALWRHLGLPCFQVADGSF